MIPNANTHCVKHSAVGPSFLMPLYLADVSVPRDKPFPVSLPEWPKIISTARKFPDLSHILTVPRCQIWTPPRTASCPACAKKKNHAAWFNIQEKISSANNTYLKITPDKIETAMFVAWTFFFFFFFKRKQHFLKRSRWIIWTCNLPGKIPLFGALKRFYIMLLLESCPEQTRISGFIMTVNTRRSNTRELRVWFVGHFCWHDWLLAAVMFQGCDLHLLAMCCWGWCRGLSLPAGLRTTGTSRVISHPCTTPVEFLAVMFSQASPASAALPALSNRGALAEVCVLPFLQQNYPTHPIKVECLLIVSGQVCRFVLFSGRSHLMSWSSLDGIWLLKVSG